MSLLLLLVTMNGKPVFMFLKSCISHKLENTTCWIMIKPWPLTFHPPLKSSCFVLYRGWHFWFVCCCCSVFLKKRIILLHKINSSLEINLISYLPQKQNSVFWSEVRLTLLTIMNISKSVTLQEDLFPKVSCW